MIDININKITKNYGFNKVLEELSLELKTGERIALIGPNGSGKTTTFRIIMGDETPDNGTISIRKNISIGYMKQIPPKESSTVLAKEVFLRGVEELLNLEKELNYFRNNMSSNDTDIRKLTILEEEFNIKGGYFLAERINKIKKGFKLSEDLLNSEYNVLSGGEKTIVNLASLILSNPDVLLLDEPTNHLDIDTLEWFEEYLKNYKGSIMIISHDRYFLDRVVNKIVLIKDDKEDIYYGNYSYYLIESEKREILEFQNYKNQQKEIKALKEAIKRLKEWGQRGDNPIFFRRAASMEKRLAKIDVISKPKTKKELPISFKNINRSGNIVLDIKDLNLEIGNKQLLESASLELYYKDRLCLMGNNGTGKTTLIKEILKNDSLNIKIGSNIKLGYIPQEIRFNDEEITIYDYVRSFYIGSETELRSKLYQFYFGEESLNKKIKVLSGGEKVRIKLLELILKEINLLILDEPTNHIDIDTREILEMSLNDFEGTILFVSHDRYFINKISTRIVQIENKKLINYEGNYNYLKAKQIPINEPYILKSKTIQIDGSNRLKEFIKESKIEEISNDCFGKKIYKIRKKSKTYYLKIANHLSEESIRLDYLKDKIIIPEKVFYEKYNDKSYILTKALKGDMLCSDYFNNNPNIGIKIIVEAFNALYNINYSDCVIDETIDVKIKRIEQKFNKVKEENISPNILKRFHNKQGILNYIKGNKPKQVLGFTHGDMSLSNIFAFDNHFSGILDVDHCGIADIYFDIVSCEKSIEENYGKEYIDVFYEELGIEKDEFKSDYYRIMLELY